MIAAFETYLGVHAGLSELDISYISSLAVQRKLKRGGSALNEGEVCRHKTFIVNGILCTNNIAEDGSETILQFSPQLTWTLDVESYDKEQPSRFNIVAIEASEILQWPKNDFQKLLAGFPGLRQLSERLISNNIYNSRQRLLTALSATPEEKYEGFVQQYPDLLARVPLRMIASYLGISLKTLTRIRHAQVMR